MSKPYFHEASQKTVSTLVKNHATWGDIMEQYQQPEWCNYPEALSGSMGCWSLTDLSKGGFRKKISKEWCSGCDECKKDEVI
jgi:hypothetical protein